MKSNYEEMVEVLNVRPKKNKGARILEDESPVELYGKKLPLQLLFEIAFAESKQSGKKYDSALNKVRKRFGVPKDFTCISNVMHTRMINYVKGMGINVDYNDPMAVILEPVEKHFNDPKKTGVYVYRIFGNSTRFVLSKQKLFPGESLGIRKLDCSRDVKMPTIVK